VTVEVDEEEEVEAIDEEELERVALFRGMNIRDTSSSLSRLRFVPLEVLHAPREMGCWKLRGGVATAVIGAISKGW
jgi:hypothetical protein